MRVVAERLEGERGGETVFGGVDFSLGKGEMLLVTGPNGSGKSTLLRVVAGLLQPAFGHVLIEGGGERFPSLGAASHYLGHLNAMKASLSVSENLCFWQEFCGEPAISPADALETVRLASIAHLPFGYLSAGQRRRAAIARLLVSHRPVWLLDEPTSGLDRASDALFSTLMRGHLDSGGIIIAATHLPLGVGGVKELAMGNAGDVPSPLLWRE